MNALAGFVERTDFWWRLKRTFLFLGVPIFAAAIVLTLATAIGLLFERPTPALPVQAPPVELKSDAPSSPTVPVDHPAAPIPTEPVVAPADIPPTSALIGARVLDAASQPPWHVEAVGTDIKGNTVSVFMRNDATQERATAPVRMFVWKWDPKRVNVPAVAYVSEPSAKSSWVWIKDKPDLPMFDPPKHVDPQ